jgi:hypothetical protein
MTSYRLGPITVTAPVEPAGVGLKFIAKTWAELPRAEPFCPWFPAHFSGFVPVHVITDPQGGIASATGLVWPANLPDQPFQHTQPCPPKA